MYIDNFVANLCVWTLALIGEIHVLPDSYFSN